MYAAFTIPGPPVASIVSAFCIRYVVSSNEGVSIQETMPCGAPASTAACNKSFAVSIVEFFALGCGLIIIPLRVFSANKILNIAVDVGLVVGITAAITPIGSAIFLMPYVLSYDKVLLLARFDLLYHKFLVLSIISN